MPPDVSGQRAALRQLLTHVLPTQEQLRAFCARHFPALGWEALPWVALLEQLLARTTVAEVRYRLALEQPAAVAHHSDYPLQVAVSATEPRRLCDVSQPRDPGFSGRAEQLGRLRGLLNRHRAAVLTGPGGVGKTALATEFLYRAGAEYAVIYLLDATTPESLGPALAALARRLQEHGFWAPPTDAPVTLGVAAARDWLSRHADWLLVVDGVRNLGEVESLLGAGPPAGHLIYTTAAAVPAGPTVLELGPLSAAESLQLLAQRSDRHKLLPGERLAVQRLAAALGYWPAALCSAADAVRTYGLTWIAALAQLTQTPAVDAGAG